MEKDFAQELIRQVLPSYEIIETIGEGSFGAVFKIRDSLKERAVKIIELSAASSIEKGSVTSAGKKIERDFRHIIDSYEKIQCEEIVTVYDFYKVIRSEDKNQAMAYAIIVMEIFPVNLYEYIMEYFEKKGSLLNIETAESLIEKLAHLLGNLYTKRKFLFEDLKPENLLVKEIQGDLKLVAGDIGGLKSIGSVSTTSSQVTLAYCAAEVLRKGQKPDVQSIIYSFGLISYFILEGHLPYEEYGVVDRIDQIREKGVVFEREDIPDHLKEVIKKCLSFEPRNRYQDFTEIVEAMHGKAAYRKDKFIKETIDLDSFIRSPSHEEPPPKEAKPYYNKFIIPKDTMGTMKGTVSQKLFTETKRKFSTIQFTEEKSEIDRIEKEIRDLVIRSGDVYKIQNESYKVYNDIRIEADAMLIIENSKLYFDENSGIISSGTLRAKNSDFCALDFSKKWQNVALNPVDARVILIEGCKFRYSKGRTWKSMKDTFNIQGCSLSDHYLYGGALFLAEAKERLITISDSLFLNCSAQEGGALYCLNANFTISNCKFDHCSATLTGGAISSIRSNIIIKNCRLKACSAHKEGGGIYCVSSNHSIENCMFDSCSTRFFYGGGIFCSASSPLIKNCKFNNCISTKDGGGIYCDDKSKPKILYPAFSNCKPNNTNFSLIDANLKKFFS